MNKSSAKYRLTNFLIFSLKTEVCFSKKNEKIEKKELDPYSPRASELPNLQFYAKECMLKKFILALMALPSLVMGKIIEADTFEEILQHLSPQTIVLCDLDNTLIEASQHLGSVQWGDHYKKKLIEAGETAEKAEEMMEQFWLKMLPTVPMRLVDAEAPKIIENMQQKGTLVLGLTARYSEEAPYTHPQLNQFGIHFNQFFEKEINLKAPLLYEKGILFSGTHKKSEALLAFLKQLPQLPQKIIFIDDKYRHIQDLENALASFQLDYVGIRFSKTDERIHAFNPLIAEIQEEFFPEFITDEEALQILHSLSNSNELMEANH